MQNVVVTVDDDDNQHKPKNLQFWLSKEVICKDWDMQTIFLEYLDLKNQILRKYLWEICLSFIMQNALFIPKEDLNPNQSFVLQLAQLALLTKKNGTTLWGGLCWSIGSSFRNEGQFHLWVPNNIWKLTWLPLYLIQTVKIILRVNYTAQYCFCPHSGPLQKCPEEVRHWGTSRDARIKMIESSQWAGKESKSALILITALTTLQKLASKIDKVMSSCF